MSLNIEMVPVPAGSFQRDEGEENISVITKAYSLGKYPITREQFLDVMGEDPSGKTMFSDMEEPVQTINWYHAIAFCNKLSIKEGLSPAYTVNGVSDWEKLAFDDIPKDNNNDDWDAITCNWDATGYRLPTEMEWMWAAMGADQDAREGAMQNGINRTGYTKGYAGSTEEGDEQEDMEDYACYGFGYTNYRAVVKPVGEYEPNELGLYDMSGNVLEWCWDWYEEVYGTLTDYRGASLGTERILRGGSWNTDAFYCTVALRGYTIPYSWGDDNIGFRVLRPVQMNDASLSALTASTGTLSPVFNAATTSYTVTVPNSGDTLTVTGTKAVANAKMTPSSGVLSFTGLSVGTSSEQILKVISQDGSATKEYKVKVVKLPSLSDLSTSTGTLSPNFSPTETSYTVIVPNSVTSLIVTGTADANATMTPSELSFTNLTVDTPSEQIIKVTAEDGTTTQEYKVKVTRFEELEMCRVSAGSFQRNKGEDNISEITKPYSLSKYQITRKQFLDIMGEDPSDTSFVSGTTDDEKQSNPVQNVNWYHAIAFCNKLSLLEGLTPAYTVSGVSDWASLAFNSIPTTDNATWNAAECNFNVTGYRLPTQTERMWAAMGAPADGQNGGINTTGYSKAYAGQGYGAGTSINDYAWYNENSDHKTHPVGEKEPNELGLYDMSGNVLEWCWDLWALKEDNPTGTLTDYTGAGSGSYRVLRGGSWNHKGSYCTLALRGHDIPCIRHRSFGFRILRPVQQEFRGGIANEVSKLNHLLRVLFCEDRYIIFYIRVKNYFDSFASKTVELIVRDLHVARHNNTGYTGYKIKTSRLASVARRDGVLGEP